MDCDGRSARVRGPRRCQLGRVINAVSDAVYEATMTRVKDAHVHKLARPPHPPAAGSGGISSEKRDARVIERAHREKRHAPGPAHARAQGLQHRDAHSNRDARADDRHPELKRERLEHLPASLCSLLPLHQKAGRRRREGLRVHHMALRVVASVKVRGTVYDANSKIAHAAIYEVEGLRSVGHLAREKRSLIKGHVLDGEPLLRAQVAHNRGRESLLVASGHVGEPRWPGDGRDAEPQVSAKHRCC